MDLMYVYKLLMGCLILMLGNILHYLIISHVDTDIKYLSPDASILLHSIFLIIVWLTCGMDYLTTLFMLQAYMFLKSACMILMS